MARREYGSGSVYPDSQRPGQWIIAIQDGWTANGTRRKRRRRFKGTEAGARKALRQWLNEGLAAQSTPTTVKAWADRWLGIHVDRVRPQAFATDRSAVRRWIIPTIGHRKLDTLTPADIRAVDKAQQAGGLAPSSIVRTRGVLVKLLRDARAEGHTVPDRALEVPAPRMGESSREDIPVDHALAILSAAAHQPDGSRWAAAFLQGLRPAEALGLTWECVHEDHLDISWQLKALPYQVSRDPSSGFRVPQGFTARQLWRSYHLVRPKTKAGQRIVPLTPWMAQSLADWRERQGGSPHGLVWPRPGGHPRRDDDDRDRWRDLLAAARADYAQAHPRAAAMPHYDLYSARHTTVTLLSRAGVDRSVIEAIVGHSKLVESYRHVDQTEARAAIEALGKALGR